MDKCELINKAEVVEDKCKGLGWYERFEPKGNNTKTKGAKNVRRAKDNS